MDFSEKYNITVPKTTLGGTEQCTAGVWSLNQVDLVSIDTAIYIKVVKSAYTTEPSNSPLTLLRFTPLKSVQKYMKASTIFDNSIQRTDFHAC